MQLMSGSKRATSAPAVRKLMAPPLSKGVASSVAGTEILYLTGEVETYFDLLQDSFNNAMLGVVYFIAIKMSE